MTTLEIILVIGAIALLAITVFAIATAKLYKEKHERIQKRFGSEYDRVLEQTGDARKADRLLENRVKRVRSFKIRALPSAEKRLYQDRWHSIQERFVDSPQGAVRDAHELVLQLMSAIGYPDAEVDQRVEDVSVHHPELVGHYRAACDVARGARSSTASTEDLRQATIHYRALFDELLEEHPPKRSWLPGREPEPART